MKIKYLLAGLILVVFLSIGAGCIYVETPPPFTPPPSAGTAPTDPDWTLPSTEGQSLLLPDFISVVVKVKPSVVAINTEVTSYDIFNRPFTQEGAGSGWIIDEDGLIVTNNHVVEGAEGITIILDDGRALTAGIVGTDALTDLAVLKIDGTNLPAAYIGDSSKLRIGEWVMAIGNALGMGISAKEGIVSRLEVSIPVSSGQTLYDLIETSAAINPGNSGGPLVNMAGEVIGITSAKLAAVEVEGLGYAISSKVAMPIIVELIQKGYITRPYLGIMFGNIDQWPAIRYDLAVDKGVFITQVAAGSPADKAGLEAGDVIVSFDGEEITNGQELVQAIHSSQIGQKVEIIFWRGGAKISTEVIFVESPPP